MTLLDLLYKKVKGFGVSGSPDMLYTVFGHIIYFVFDGIDLNYFFRGESGKSQIKPPYLNAYMLYATKYLNYYTAEDVTGIEVMFQDKYTANYAIAYRNLFGGPCVYLEITTRSKHGPFMQVTPGTYLFKTLPFSVATQFYSPKYTVKNKTAAMGTDMRSTLYWKPNVITDAEGKASLSFYTADKISAYNVIIEGSNGEGNIGQKQQTINPVTKIVYNK